MFHIFEYAWETLVLVEVFLLIGLILVAVIIFYLLKLLKGRQNHDVEHVVCWTIPLLSLQKIEPISPFFLKETPFRIPIESKKESGRFGYYMYRNIAVVGLKHPRRPRDDISSSVLLHTMVKLKFPNLNCFMGLTVQDPSTIMSIWKYCCRGSIHDVINQNNLKFDEFIKMSFIHDTVNGLNYLHNSTLKFHGRLNSKCCLVSDRWRIQISQYGLYNLGISSPPDEYQKLYLSPEILNGECTGSPEADMYSLSIICSEIINVTDCWNISTNELSPQDILEDVKTGRSRRPEIDEKASTMMDQRIIPLIKKGWSFVPRARPTIKELKDVCESLCPGRNGSLIDHIVEDVRHECKQLEKQLKRRTDELLKEKNNSDKLLYRMLPKSVAECLKSGKGVVPEAYESVSILFSDIVSFTTISSSCSPWQVVSLLNDLYTKMDSVVNGFDVYKVETIGDCYMLVSGVPERNGTEHIKNICESALRLVQATSNIRLPHDSSKFLELRVGIHTGPVVAGVVGLIMPRFCLFGDTVNTASRMESTGEASKIHLSPNAQQLLKQTYPQFQTISRGEIEVKGKGVMHTYWLLQ